jgi:hypothetical protein
MDLRSTIRPMSKPLGSHDNTRQEMQIGHETRNISTTAWAPVLRLAAPIGVCVASLAALASGGGVVRASSRAEAPATVPECQYADPCAGGYWDGIWWVCTITCRQLPVPKPSHAKYHGDCSYVWCDPTDDCPDTSSVWTEKRRTRQVWRVPVQWNPMRYAYYSNSNPNDVDLACCHCNMPPVPPL